LKAKKRFGEVIKIAPLDGPSKAIFEFMQEFEFKTPENWQGYRELVDH